MTRYVGVDLHRRRSVIVVLEGDGTELWSRRIDNDPLALGLEIEEAGPSPEVVLEATWGWYLGGGCDRQGGWPGASGASSRCGGVREPAGQERPDRRPPVGGPVEDGPVAGVVDPA